MGGDRRLDIHPGIGMISLTREKTEMPKTTKKPTQTKDTHLYLSVPVWKALQKKADEEHRSLTAQASLYVLQGLKRDGADV